MKRVIAILTLSVLIGPVVAEAAQSGSAQQPSSPTLVDVAKAEEERRKGVRKPAKVYTNNDLKPDHGTVRPLPPTPATPATPETPGNVTPGAAVVNLPGGTGSAPAAPTGDQEFWSGRITTARTALDRSRMFAEALQSRINALTTDFVNRDDPAQRAVIETDRKSALAELDRVRAEIEKQQKEIAAIEDEARRAGVPSGWLRPGA
ncbi:MAG: hypothetical protein Q8T13_05490 [Acidobacteriota bacterium]|nr:hypothetical protein [Acidobacteriota bacterium]